MRYNVKELDANYDFEITGVSFIGEPKNGTALFVTRKMRGQLANMKERENCLIFGELGMEIPQEIREKNCVLLSADPLMAYGHLAQVLAAQEAEDRPLTLMPGGYYLGEEVKLGQDVRIEPGCLIDHGVEIGDGARIGLGTVIRHARIGKNFHCGEHTCIGTPAYFPSGEGDDAFRIPAFGQVIIGDDNDFGGSVIIERGFNKDTVIGNHAMIDAHVSIGHDVKIGNRVRIICGTSLAGLVTVGDDVYIGMNACVKQRLTIGDGAQVGMGAVVITRVRPDTKVFGNPAMISE